MKLIFAGTPEFAVLPLRELYRVYRGDLVAVVTQPDKPQGRRGILTPPPVKRAAEELGIPVLQPAKLKDDVSALSALRADLMVTCAYGQILTQEVLDVFPMGVWNIHASLLPAYRGAAPIARAIMDGAKETGITVMKTELGLDTGDILLSAREEIGEADTCGSLSEKLSRLGARLIVQAMDMLGRGAFSLLPQGEGSVCRKVQRTQADFSRPAVEVSRLIRGLSPAPLAYGVVNGLSINFYFAETLPCEEEAPCGTVLFASPKTGLIVKCGEGAVRLCDLQPAGGKRMRDADFCNGRNLQGARFDQPIL